MDASVRHGSCGGAEAVSKCSAHVSGQRYVLPDGIWRRLGWGFRGGVRASGTFAANPVGAGTSASVWSASPVGVSYDAVDSGESARRTDSTPMAAVCELQLMHHPQLRGGVIGDEEPSSPAAAIECSGEW